MESALASYLRTSLQMFAVGRDSAPLRQVLANSGAFLPTHVLPKPVRHVLAVVWLDRWRLGGRMAMI
jgi:hypothetical protein